MPKFCNKCGSPVSGPFCGKCGADTRPTSSQPQPAAQSPLPSAPQIPQPSVPQIPQPPVPQSVTPTPAAPAPVYAAPQAAVSSAPAKGSPLAKILIGVAVVLIAMSALAAGGVYYVVHRVKEKVHEVINGTTSDANNNDSNTTASNNKETSGGASEEGAPQGDPCRYLSKEEVGRAIGVEIVSAQADGESCGYMAKGKPGEMSAKHAAKMLGDKGADAKTQQMIQTFAQGVFNSMPQEKQDRTADKSGNVPVLAFSVSDSPASIAEMNLNAKGLGHIDPTQEQLSNIGDQAFVTANSMMMIRKGKKIIRIMFMECPCTATQIKPLAAKLVESL